MNRYLELLDKNKMTLIMSLPSNNPELAECAFDYGADVVKVHINVDHRASKNSFKSIEEESAAFTQMLSKAKGPMGIVLGGSTELAERDMTKAVDLGFEFVSLYAHHTPVCVLNNPKIAKMMACDYTYTMDEVNSFKNIGIDVVEASIVHPEGYGQELNARDILKYDYLCKHSGLPVVVPTQRKVKASEIAKLYEVGVKAVMVGAVVTGKELESIKRTVCDFKEAILKL